MKSSPFTYGTVAQIMVLADAIEELASKQTAETLQIFNKIYGEWKTPVNKEDTDYTLP